MVSLGDWWQPTYHVVTVVPGPLGLVTDEQRVRARGRFVDLLPNRGDRVLWSIDAPTHTSVYEVAIPELLRAEGRSLDDPERHPRVAHLEDKVERWVTDRHGTVRAALRSKAEVWDLVYRASSEAAWSTLLSADDRDEMPVPVGIAENDRDLIVASKAGRDTFGLFELSVESGQIGRELFAHPEADVTDVVMDYSGAIVLAAVYEFEGLEEFHYFDPFYDRYQRSLEHVFPGAVVDMASMSADQRYVVVITSSAWDPGTFYVLDTHTNTATEAGRSAPWIDPREMADVESLKVDATDGRQLEVFLARPRGDARKWPLVAMPHGGPIGVRDTRSFDPLVQYLAAGGLAVLQVNYRGSSGRGESFLEAGQRQWGTGIEEDIEAAVEKVKRLEWVDGERICIAGGSYGGYSALISVIRRPELYRCAASLNGPTDLPFLYYSSWDLHGTPKGREYFETYVGDPDEEHDRLVSISPVYRAAEIQVPVLLVQSSEDGRVDVDHFYRMQAVLEALDKPHEAHLLRGGGHIPSSFEWIDYASWLRAFLVRHLAP
jgi:dipeptidyl aminopeptidase/acylaminoacyl peptidase